MRRPLTAALGLLLAQSAAADDARLPRPRPDVDVAQWAASVEQELVRAETETDTAPATAEWSANPADGFAAIAALARVPRPRPGGATAPLALMPLGDIRPLPSVPDMSPERVAEHLACLAHLAELGVAFTEEPPIAERPAIAVASLSGGVEPACVVEHPLRVTAIAPGVGVAPDAVMSCAAAEALAQWARAVLRPAAEEVLASTANEIVHASAYVCRPRNNAAGASLSEHARGDAVDVGSIRFADRAPLVIGDAEASAAERRFEAAIRAGACDYFTTVLGPGSDAAHATHLHFDVAERNGGYRLCDLGEAKEGAD
jgi:hypothetical protein